MIQGIYSVLDAVMNWALHNKVREVMVLDGIPVEGLPDPKRTPIILSSDGKKADEANLIHDYNIDAKKEEVDDAASVYPSTAFVPGLAYWRNFVLLSVEWNSFESLTHTCISWDTGPGGGSHFIRLTW